MNKPQIIVHAEQSLNYTVFDTKWIPCSPKIIVLGSNPAGTGAFQIYELGNGSLNLIKEEHKGKSLKCGTFGASSMQQRNFATGDFSGKMQIWNLERLSVPVYSVSAHDEIINAIDGVGGLGIGKGAPEIVTGSRDGTVKLWDPRQRDVPVAKMEPSSEESKRDCWTVAFGNAYHQNERCICAGYDNGDVKLFDLRTMSVKWETNIKNGVCCVEFDRKDIQMNKLVVSSLESKFRVYNVKTLHPKKGYPHLQERAHKSTVWLVRHLPQNRDIFMTTGGNGSLYLWKYIYPEKLTVRDSDDMEMGVIGNLTQCQNMIVAQQPITGFDWNPDKQGLAVCSSFDQAVRVVIVTKLNTL
uniref:Dynein axonemal assembly factor 10 n=1 Tax=Hemiscolopendra marginata TaxID=943146 RepID=A0A646QC37_9MYRI